MRRMALGLVAAVLAGSLVQGGGSEEGTYKIDPSKTPKHIDAVEKRGDKDAAVVTLTREKS